MRDKRGTIISKKEFMKDGLYAKEEYEGLLVSSDLQEGCYDLGIQIAENRILVVDQARENNINERIQTWVPQIQEIQRQYNAENDSKNYAR